MIDSFILTREFLVSEGCYNQENMNKGSSNIKKLPDYQAVRCLYPIPFKCEVFSKRKASLLPLRS